ncbi:hypothetical protein [Nocardioides campestrisoli]|uniref:hypothetical protein n=1 Tax=Nocardioides campestrisoli TaxID=2736757 RepID=UPI00163DA276|nr:hypothetical protein [Nocardioides campestrisoli]
MREPTGRALRPTGMPAFFRTVLPRTGLPRTGLSRTGLPRRGPLSARPTAAAAAGLLGLALLAGCGTDDGSSGSGGTGTEASASPSDELAESAGEVCPADLPEPDEADQSRLGEPAASAPALSDAQQAWVCRYEPSVGSAEESGGSTWQRVGTAQAVDPDSLPRIDKALAGLVPAEPDRACTMELGPRRVLVIAHEGDLTGVVVDDFGCREVRLTSAPADRVAGLDKAEGIVPGVLSAPDDLVAFLRAMDQPVIEPGPGASGGQPGEQDQAHQQRWEAMTARLDCAGGPPSVFMSGRPAEPAATTTLREAAASWLKTGGELRVDSRTTSQAELSVLVDGKVVVVLAATRAASGGWFVEGGAEC